jgi:D-alanine-D-alanine ligase
MKIGLAYDLKSDLAIAEGGPDDALEEYDGEETVESIVRALTRLHHRVIRLGGGRDFLTAVLTEKVDMVFTIAEGRGNYRSREGQVPAVLEMLGIPYVGSDPTCLAVCLDKPLAKHLVAAAGIMTPSWQLVADGHVLDAIDWSGFPFPAFAKPAWEGSSKGIGRGARVESFPAMKQEVLRLLATYQQPVLVEEFIRGRELTAGIVGSPPRVMGIMAVVPLGGADPDFFYSIEIKRDWRRQVRYECPAALSRETAARIANDSLTVFKTLGCRDMARIDFRLDDRGNPYFIEANPLPGLTPGHSDYPMIAQHAGIDYVSLIENMLDSALRRKNACVQMSA